MKWLAIILQILILVAFLVWESYFKEKGKNLATKEDIGDITKEIESVKKTFSDDTEKMKANLSLATNLQTGIFAEERDAILCFTKSLVIWINSYQKNHKLKEGNINGFINNIEVCQDDCMLAIAKVQLLVENQEVAKQACSLMVKAGDLDLLKPRLDSLKLKNRDKDIREYQELFKTAYERVSPDIEEFIQLSRVYIREQLTKPV